MHSITDLERMITAPRDRRAVYDLTQAVLRGNHRPVSPFGDADLRDHEGFGDDYDDRVVTADPLHQFVPTDEIPFAADDDREEGDNEGIEDWDGEDFPPEGTILVHRSPEVKEQLRASRRQGVSRFRTKTIILEGRVAIAKPEPAKGNGNGHGHKPATPPVGKFLTGTVVEQFPEHGLHVEAEGVGCVRVPIALERGHGSWSAAKQWLMGFQLGAKVRVKVVRVPVNGHMIVETVLSDRHPRPWWQRKAGPQPAQAPAAN